MQYAAKITTILLQIPPISLQYHAVAMSFLSLQTTLLWSLIVTSRGVTRSPSLCRHTSSLLWSNARGIQLVVRHIPGWLSLSEGPSPPLGVVSVPMDPLHHIMHIGALGFPNGGPIVHQVELYVCLPDSRSDGVVSGRPNHQLRWLVHVRIRVSSDSPPVQDSSQAQVQPVPPRRRFVHSKPLPQT